MTHPRETYGEGSRFEELGGYSRAVRSGQHVAVAGTAPIDQGVPVHAGDVYAQTLFSLRKAVAAGFSGHGFMIAPAVGRILADAVEGRHDPILDLLDAARFAEGRPVHEPQIV